MGTRFQPLVDANRVARRFGHAGYQLHLVDGRYTTSSSIKRNVSASPGRDLQRTEGQVSDQIEAILHSWRAATLR